MKRSLKALLVAGAATAALVGPAAAPASAGTCVGIDYQSFGPDQIGAWTCDPCAPGTQLGDGRLYVVACIEPRY